MNVRLTVVQLWALVAGGPIAMVLTVLVGILINNAVTCAKIVGVEGGLTGEMKSLSGRVDGLASELQRVEGTLKSELHRIVGVLGAKLDGLTGRVKAPEDEMRLPLVKQ